MGQIALGWRRKICLRQSILDSTIVEHMPVFTCLCWIINMQWHMSIWLLKACVILHPSTPIVYDDYMTLGICCTTVVGQKQEISPDNMFLRFIIVVKFLGLMIQNSQVSTVCQINLWIILLMKIINVTSSTYGVVIMLLNQPLWEAWLLFEFITFLT